MLRIWGKTVNLMHLIFLSPTNSSLFERDLHTTNLQKKETAQKWSVMLQSCHSLSLAPPFISEPLIHSSQVIIKMYWLHLCMEISAPLIDQQNNFPLAWVQFCKCIVTLTSRPNLALDIMMTALIACYYVSCRKYSNSRNWISTSSTNWIFYFLS